MTVAPSATPQSSPGSVIRVSPEPGAAVDVVYERRGSGEPMLLLHGIGHHWQAWEPVLDALAASYEVTAIDLPGFGASQGLPPGHPYGVATMVPVLAEIARALGMERPHVVGNSLGGLLALELGLHGHARSVTALSPAGFWNEPERRWAFGVLKALRLGTESMPEGLVRRLTNSVAGRAALVGSIYHRPGRRAPEAVRAEVAALRGAVGFADTLAAGRSPEAHFTGDITDVPVTVAWGDRDRLLVPRQGVRAKRALPDARLVRLPRCGHVPMSDDPALVARVALDTAARA
ncbi:MULTISPECIES: alpha/beta fold hydrolase [unclassified Streptomyces]|uniref:alpha/beta fold hydrolase n=1 Tax=unclassified Streptomyces TaxID=2593676 RepID=UPI0022B6E6A8|nr:MULTISPECIES: alpha/beta fold hydrolase [unclassified Streptomyces]MCZ7415842.1 alpha/beta fold hydrolase [Streptomyces sp. WMMC897]MCZ7434349.1 alpha/beta fold hydrolase [Streptomyces sp. WMMC1477]